MLFVGKRRCASCCNYINNEIGVGASCVEDAEISSFLKHNLLVNPIEENKEIQHSVMIDGLDILQNSMN